MNTQLIHKLFDVATFDESRVRSYVNEDGSQTEIYQPYIPLTWCGEPTRFSITQEQINKFVELIVQECIELNRQELAFNAFERLLNKYNEHFGVE